MHDSLGMHTAQSTTKLRALPTELTVSGTSRNNAHTQAAENSVSPLSGQRASFQYFLHYTPTTKPSHTCTGA